MRLIFRQRIFSWFDGYDIYDKDGNVLFTVKGQLSWGHRLHILDASGQHIGTIQEQVLTWLPKFEMYAGNTYIGCIRKELTFIHPRYVIDSLGWEVVGDFWEWDYSIVDSNGSDIAFVSKQVFRLTDTYVIDVADPGDALYALMMVLAIDAEKCSRS